MPEPEREGGVGEVEFYRLVRARLEHEDGLIVNRLSWLVASQSFLFTAYAIVLNGLSSPMSGAVADRHHLLLTLIPTVGMGTAGLISFGLVAAVRAMSWLREIFRARVPDETRLGLPPIRTPDTARRLGLVAPLVLPVLFIVVWVALVISPVR